MEPVTGDREVEPIDHRGLGTTAGRRDDEQLGYVLPSDQARFWLMHELVPRQPVCNLAVLLRFDGDLDHLRLRACLDAVVDAHEALRSRLTHKGTRVTAHPIPAPVGCPWLSVDLTSLAGAAQTHQLDDTVQEAARLRFDLSQPPLLRATLMQLSAFEHVLVLVSHHAVVDGTAMFHLIPTELCARYDGTHLPSTTLTCAEWSLLERARDQSPNVASDQRYFAKRLRDAPNAIALPIDRAFPSHPSMAGRTVERQLDTNTGRRVATLAKSLGVRPFDVMCGAFVAQLMRYSGDLDVVFGTPIANRGTVEGARELVNCCIDTQIVRVNFDADDTPTFAKIATAIAADRRAGRAHRTASFSSIIDNLVAQRNPSRNPVYQVMFNYMGFSVADVTMTSLRVQGARVPVGISMVDLSLDVIETRDGPQLSLEYNSDVFDHDHADRMLGHFVELLTAGLDAPDTVPLGDLSLLPPAERAEVARLSCGPTLAFATDRLFHELIWDAALQTTGTAGAIALHSDRSRRSYATCLRGAQALSFELQTRGVAPGVAVALCAIDDPAATVQAMFAVWLAGGMVVPLDASVPETRLQALLSDCGAAIYVADAPLPYGWAAGFTHVDARTPTTDDATTLGAVPPRAAGLTPEHPAYLMYTSGSSGQPKGVLVSHANLAHQLHARLSRYATKPVRMLAPYSFGFDSFIAGLTLTLAQGGTLRLLDDDQRRDPRVLRDVIRREGVTHLDVVPSMYAALLSLARPHDLDSLQVVVCGGEALPASLVALHWQLVPSARLFNEYGPTEATVFATVHEIPRGVVDNITPIGQPIADTQCWIIDHFGSLAPVGHHGELVIGGGGIALGYRNRDTDTQQRFHAMAGLGQRLYHSGDLARYRGDGVLEFLGRVDEQVQVRGYRVEPAEVEAALKQQPRIEDAAVILREDIPGSPQLVAYVTTNGPRSTWQAANVLRELRDVLPAYMVPSAVVPLELMPRTANGKLDRFMLPAPVIATGEREITGPRNAAERAIVELWREVLKVDRVGVDDNFFELGGHSLLAIRLVSLIEERLGKHVAVATLFRAPTPATLARALDPGGSSSTLRCIEELCTQGDGVPMVFVGSLVQARALASRLPPTRRMYGLNMFGLHDDAKVPSMEVDWIADEFVREVRKVLPRGPYALAGYCEDGKVACEMARRLRAAGEQVALVALIDAVWCFEAPDDVLSKATVFARHIRDFGVSFAANKARRRLVNTVVDKVRRLDGGVRRRLGQIPAWQVAHEAMVTRYLNALGRYNARADIDAMVLYVAQEWHLDPKQRASVPIRVVSGLHDQLFDGPHLEELAARIDEDLAAVDQTHHCAR